MRGIVAGLASPSPFLQRLPGVYQEVDEQDFFPRFLAAFDDCVAPTLSTLDNLAAYIDPSLAPEDFVDWVAAWVDITVDGGWTLDQRREIVSKAVALHRRAGTSDGIRDAARLVAGPDAVVEIEDSGGVSFSRTPGGEFPGTAAPFVRITVTGVLDEDARRRIERVLSTVIPAHVPWALASPGATTSTAVPAGGDTP